MQRQTVQVQVQNLKFTALKGHAWVQTNKVTCLIKGNKADPLTLALAQDEEGAFDGTILLEQYGSIKKMDVAELKEKWPEVVDESGLVDNDMLLAVWLE